MCLCLELPVVRWYMIQQCTSLCIMVIVLFCMIGQIKIVMVVRTNYGKFIHQQCMKTQLQQAWEFGAVMMMISNLQLFIIL